MSLCGLACDDMQGRLLNCLEIDTPHDASRRLMEWSAEIILFVPVRVMLA